MYYRRFLLIFITALGGNLSWTFLTGNPSPDSTQSFTNFLSRKLGLPIVTVISIFPFKNLEPYRVRTTRIILLGVTYFVALNAFEFKSELITSSYIPLLYHMTIDCQLGLWITTRHVLATPIKHLR